MIGHVLFLLAFALHRQLVELGQEAAIDVPALWWSAAHAAMGSSSWLVMQPLLRAAGLQPITELQAVANASQGEALAIGGLDVDE